MYEDGAYRSGDTSESNSVNKQPIDHESKDTEPKNDLTNASKSPNYDLGSKKTPTKPARRNMVPPLKGSNALRIENKRRVLPVLIKRQMHVACPDSGAEKNIMSEAFALQFRHKIRRLGPKDRKRFELGNGKLIWSEGRVRAQVELPGNPLTRKWCWFHVFASCPFPLILGSPFLDEAEILTKNQHLLQACPPEIRGIPSLLSIGRPGRRMKCSLDGHCLLANPDTGSDLNFISLKCAKREGFQIDRSPEARRRIRIGDGTETETLGQIHVSCLTLDWNQPETDTTSTSNYRGIFGEIDPIETCEQPDAKLLTFQAIFHVLPGLPCDVIFGSELLEMTNAFKISPDLASKRKPSIHSELDLSIDANDPFDFKIYINLGFIHSIVSKLLNTGDLPEERTAQERHSLVHRKENASSQGS